MALTDFMEPCTRLRFTGACNGLGGQDFTCQSEAPCLAAFALDSGNEKESAAQLRRVNTWTVLVREGVDIQRGDILRRTRDGKRFRVILAQEKRLPDYSALGVCWYRAEEVETP